MTGLINVNKKENMLLLLESNQLSELYINYFEKVKIIHLGEIVKKNQGSFFTKFVHTFKPDEFSALDNLIKNHFGLGGESYFISFLAISQAYKNWCAENEDLILHFKKLFIQLDRAGNYPIGQLSNIKLLDLIFWYIAKQNASTTLSQNSK